MDPHLKINAHKGLYSGMGIMLGTQPRLATTSLTCDDWQDSDAWI
jgi:hypothetical protein